MINTIFKSGLLLHVIAGVFALTSGLAAMTIGKKGGKVHNLAGQIFYWSMLVIFVTTVLFFVIFPEKLKYQFFLTIGIVSFYPTWSGKRMLSMKKEITPKWFDTLGGFAIGLSGVMMMCYGIYGFMKPQSFGGLQYLFLVFGIVSLLNAYGDLKYYLNFKTAPKMHWFFAHGGKMMGAYSAALTAFCVNIVPRYLPQNLPFYYYLFTWIAPGIVIAIISKRVLKKYKMKFNVA
ncbi:MAG TPA: hypothetical protein VK175_13010 [Leadbetterella sp.]|nr:hypothetical protein [Leadbetterella sp.]